MPDKTKHPLTNLTNKEYCALKESRCPYCGSDEFEGGNVQIDGSTAWQPITCWDCGKRWIDIYILAGYEPVDMEEITVNHIDKVISEKGK